MDLSSFTKSDWLKIGGAIGIFIFGFFDWISVSASVPGLGDTSTSGGNVFHFFWTGTIPWLLIIAVAVLTVLLALKVLDPKMAPWALVMLAATGLAALLLIIRLVFNPIEGSDVAEEILGLDVGRGVGMYLSTIAGIVAFGGAFMGFKESGGDLNDLKDVDKLKRQFGVGGQSTGESAPPPPPPPPPPPGSTPPPPPPAP